MTLSFRWLAPVFVACAAVPVRADDSISSTLRGEVRKYLTRYEVKFREVHQAREEAQWRRAVSNPDDRDAAEAVRAAEQAWTDFAGSIENIELSRTYLRRATQIVALDQRQLASIAFVAAGSP